MPNRNANAYALTTLCPLVVDSGRDESPLAIIRDRLDGYPTDHLSPMAKVPNTYFSRFFVLDDVVYEARPARLDRLESNYLVFNSDFHGELEPYLLGMWKEAEPFIRDVWEFCVGFKEVRDAPTFARYIKRCQVETTFYFVGSTDEPLREQLKSLYLKQEFAKFAHEHQGWPAAKLQSAFREFVAKVEPFNADSPSWRPGAATLADTVVP
ncbi:MAG TPA: hypothetical protein VF395_07255 [Polyangiaceae bacterium]